MISNIGISESLSINARVAALLQRSNAVANVMVLIVTK